MKIKNSLITAFAAAVVLAGGAAACTEDGADLPNPVSPAPAPESPPSQPDLAPEEEEAVEEVQLAIDEFLTAFQEALVNGDPAIGSPPHLGAGTILDQVYGEVVNNYANNRRADGQIEWTFLNVVEADLEHVIVRGENELHRPLVELRYCADATAWQVVDKDTGQPTARGEDIVTPQPGQRHTVVFSMYYFDTIPDGEDPSWWVEEWINEEDQAC